MQLTRDAIKQDEKALEAIMDELEAGAKGFEENTEDEENKYFVDSFGVQPAAVVMIALRGGWNVEAFMGGFALGTLFERRNA
jgi:hypothetical protein